MNTNKAIVVVVSVALLALGGWWWWASQREAERAAQQAALAAAQAASAAQAEAAAAEAARVAAATAAAAPVIEHPIEAASAPASAAAAPADLLGTLGALLGRQTMLTLVQSDDFVRRFVATVDNLGRAHAPSRLWPLVPAAGRFTVRRQGESESFGAANAARYTPFVKLADSVDVRQLAAAYIRFYPEFQQAYVELGYPKRYFNDRLVEVIDLMLATPKVAEPIAVFRPTLNSPVQPPRPWVLYEFSDPALRELAAGQKLLLRMGKANASRVQRRLAQLRALVVRGAAQR